MKELLEHLGIMPYLSPMFDGRELNIFLTLFPYLIVIMIYMALFVKYAKILMQTKISLEVNPESLSPKVLEVHVTVVGTLLRKLRNHQSYTIVSFGLFVGIFIVGITGSIIKTGLSVPLLLLTFFGSTILYFLKMFLDQLNTETDEVNIKYNDLKLNLINNG